MKKTGEALSPRQRAYAEMIYLAMELGAALGRKGPVGTPTVVEALESPLRALSIAEADIRAIITALGLAAK